MASSAGSELPLHYGSKTADGEIIKRPQTPPNVLASPQRVYRPYTEPQPVIPSRANPSPEGIPVNADRQSFDAENPRAGLRRRPSTQPGSNPRRYSGGDYERPNYFPESGGGSRKGTMRSGSRDDAWYDERDRSTAPLRREEFSHPHPDSLERSRPPRSYRNVEGWEKRPSSASKPYFDESRGDYDVERGRDDWAAERAERRQRSIEYEESVDGYNYEQQKNPHRHPPKIDFKNMTKEERAQVMRLPWTQWMNSSVKNHFVATLGEFVGTTMFLFFAFAGTQVANIQSSASTDTASSSNTTTGATTGFNVSVYLYISVIFGFSLMVNVWIFFRISGGLFNPAVTLGMVFVGAVPIPRAIFLFIAQIAGGIAASGMVLGLFPTPLNVRTTLGGGASLVQGVFIEGILTAELVFTIFMLAKEKHKATFIAPVGIGLALFIAEMVGVYYTGGSLNPARSFGPCVVTGVFDKEHWIYWVGPFLGTCIAVFFYKFIKMLEYEMANPGQDGDPTNDPTKNEEKREQVRLERHMSRRPHSRG